METKTYTVTVSTGDDGKSQMHRINDGFNILELAGIAGLLLREFSEIMTGVIQVDTITRETVMDEKDQGGMG